MESPIVETDDEILSLRSTSQGILKEDSIHKSPSSTSGSKKQNTYRFSSSKSKEAFHHDTDPIIPEHLKLKKSTTINVNNYNKFVTIVTKVLESDDIVCSDINI